LHETWQLSHMPSPPQPCLCFLGRDEQVVDVQRIKDRMAAWTNGSLIIITPGAHEVLMEAPQVHNAILDQISAHFDAHRNQNSTS